MYAYKRSSVCLARTFDAYQTDSLDVRAGTLVGPLPNCSQVLVFSPDIINFVQNLGQAETNLSMNSAGECDRKSQPPRVILVFVYGPLDITMHISGRLLS